MKKDEWLLFCAIIHKNKEETVRNVINKYHKLGYIHYKRAWYLLQKWSAKGYYNYGVSLDLGWMEDKGIQKHNEIAGNYF